MLYAGVMDSKRLTITVPADFAALISDFAPADRCTVANWCYHQLKLAARAQAAPSPEKVAQAGVWGKLLEGRVASQEFS